MHGLLVACLDSLKAQGDLGADESGPNLEEVKDCTTEQLLGSPLLTLKVRWLVTAEIFTRPVVIEKMSFEDLFKLVDLDPFLQAQDDMRKANAVKCIDDALKDRNAWSTLTTVWAPTLTLTG